LPEDVIRFTERYDSLRLSFEFEIGVHYRIEGDKKDGNNGEIEGIGLKEDAKDGEDAGNLEEGSSSFMRFFPYLFTAQGPGCPNPYEPIPFCMLKKNARIIEEKTEPHRQYKVGTYSCASIL